jgi:hypothetical protein
MAQTRVAGRVHLAKLLIEYRERIAPSVIGRRDPGSKKLEWS